MTFDFFNRLAANSKRTIAPLCSAALLAACSTHPIQQEATGIPTKQIVERIRCEMRFAIAGKAIAKLRMRADDISGAREADNLTPEQRLEVVRRLRTIAQTLDGQLARGEPIEFNPNKLPTDRSIKFYNHFINSGIAYDFTFDITETNNASLAVDPVRAITNGTAGVTVGADFSRTRLNTRRFQLTDTFAGLLTTKDLNCGQQDTVAANLVYPVAGNIGLDELIGTFVDLSEVQLLQPLSPQNGSVFSNTLKFTTALMGGLTPHILIAAVDNRFGLASAATAGLNASRADVHTLAISLSMGAEGNVPLLEARYIAGRPGRRPFAMQASGMNVQQAIQGLDVQRQRNITDSLITVLGR